SISGLTVATIQAVANPKGCKLVPPPQPPAMIGWSRPARWEASMTKLKTVDLRLPATREDLAKLEIGTVVYLSGRVHTAREGVYKRAVEVRCNVPDGIGTASFHCSPAASVGANG